MWFDEQVKPQPPQLPGSVPVIWISQPFVQVGFVMLLFEQMMLQPPQWFRSLPVCVSQPFVCLFPSQSPQAFRHWPLQTPAALQVIVDMLFAEQASPQPPQLAIV